MRKSVLSLLVCLLAVPTAGLAAPDLNAVDGALSVAEGRGQIELRARGGVIGRFDRGCVSITDLTPDDSSFPLVFDDDRRQVDLPDGGVLYCGRAVRFRLIGGSFRMSVSGVGIDLSAVGVGTGTLVADDPKRPGVYSLDGDDCRSPRSVCRPLPSERTPFRLGTSADSKNDPKSDKGEKSLSRSGSG